MESFRKRPGGWLKNEMNLETSIQGFLSKAQSLDDTLLLKLDHRKVNAENLLYILSHFRFYPDDEELRLMQSQFKFDSKIEFNLKVFKE